MQSQLLPRTLLVALGQLCWGKGLFFHSPSRLTSFEIIPLNLGPQRRAVFYRGIVVLYHKVFQTHLGAFLWDTWEDTSGAVTPLSMFTDKNVCLV